MMIARVEGQGNACARRSVRSYNVQHAKHSPRAHFHEARAAGTVGDWRMLRKSRSRLVQIRAAKW